MGTLGFSLARLSSPALAHDGLMEAGTEGLWKLVDLVVAVDLNGLLGGGHDHVAFVAPMEMFVQLGLCALTDGAIQVIGQLFQKLSALHVGHLRSFLIGSILPGVREVAAARVAAGT